MLVLRSFGEVGRGGKGRGRSFLGWLRCDDGLEGESRRPVERRVERRDGRRVGSRFGRRVGLNKINNLNFTVSKINLQQLGGLIHKFFTCIIFVSIKVINKYV